MDAEALARWRLAQSRSITSNRIALAAQRQDRAIRHTVYKGYAVDGNNPIIQQLGGDIGIAGSIITTGLVSPNEAVRLTLSTVDAMPRVKPNEAVGKQKAEIDSLFKAVIRKNGIFYIVLDRKKAFKITEGTGYVDIGFSISGLKKKDWVFSVFNYNQYSNTSGQLSFYYPNSSQNFSYPTPKSISFDYSGNNNWTSIDHNISPGVRNNTYSNEVLEDIDTVTEYKRITEELQDFIYTYEAEWEPYLTPVDIGVFHLENTVLIHNKVDTGYISGEPKDFEYFVPYPFLVDGFTLNQTDRSLVANYEYTDKKFNGGELGLTSTNIIVTQQQQEKKHTESHTYSSGEEIYIQIPAPGSSRTVRKSSSVDTTSSSTDPIQTLYEYKAIGVISIYGSYTREFKKEEVQSRNRVAEGNSSRHFDVDGDWVGNPYHYETESGTTTESSSSSGEDVATINNSQVIPDVLLMGRGCCVFAEFSSQYSKETVFAASSETNTSYNYLGIGSSTIATTQNLLVTTTYSVPNKDIYIYIESSDEVIKLQKLPNLIASYQVLGIMPDIGSTGSIAFEGFQYAIKEPSTFITKAELIILNSNTVVHTYTSMHPNGYPLGTTAYTGTNPPTINKLTTVDNPLWGKLIGRKVSLSTYKEGRIYKYKGVVTSYSFDTLLNYPDHPQNSFTSIIGEYPVEKRVSRFSIDIVDSSVVPYDSFAPPDAVGYLSLYCDEGDFFIRDFQSNFTNLIAITPPEDTTQPYTVAKIYYNRYSSDLTKKQMWVEVFDVISTGLIKLSKIEKGAVFPVKESSPQILSLLYSPK